MSKPTDKPGWIPGNEPEYIEDPGSTKAHGWVDETPAPNLQFNWFWNLVSQWIEFIDEIGQAGDAGLNVIQDGSILFNGSSYNANIALNTAGTELDILPVTDNVTDLVIGTSTYSWKDISIEAENDISILAGNDISIDATAALGITSGSILTLTGTTSVNLETPELVGGDDLDIIPDTSTTYALNIGTGAALWTDIVINSSQCINLHAGTTMTLDANFGIAIDAGTFLAIDTTTYFDVDATTYIDMAATTYMNLAATTTLNIDSGDAMKIDSASTLELESGGLMTLDGAGALSAIFHGDVEISPDTDDAYDLDMGTTSYRYQFVRIKAVSAIGLSDSDSSGGVVVNFATDDLSPIPDDESWDLGTSANGWGTIYRSAEASPAELYFADSWINPKTNKIETLNDLELLCNIKGRGVYDKRQGIELVDDSTLPDCILFRNKITKEIEYNKKGQPFTDMDALLSLCVGSARILKQEIDTLKQEIETLTNK